MLWLALFAFLTFFPEPAIADAGVPMVFVTLPSMLIALVPIIVLEAIVIRRMLGISLKDAAKVSAVINMVSTVIGIPITWFILVSIEIVTAGGKAYGLETPFKKFLAVSLQAPWLIPYDKDLNWMVPAAFSWLLIFFFFMSVKLEGYIAKRMLKDLETQLINRAVLVANLWSYAVLEIIFLSMTVYNFR